MNDECRRIQEKYNELLEEHTELLKENSNLLRLLRGCCKHLEEPAQHNVECSDLLRIVQSIVYDND